MIDERALEAAISAMHESFMDGISKLSLGRFLKAYEAAKWRPIEEAPQDGSTIQIQSEKLKRPFPLFANWEDADWAGPGFRVGSVLFPLGSAHLRGAMFRTIDPPNQNTVSQAVSTPPAAETSS